MNIFQSFSAPLTRACLALTTALLALAAPAQDQSQPEVITPWKGKYGTPLTPSQFYATRAAPWFDYFKNTLECANASFFHVGPLGFRVYPYDQEPDLQKNHPIFSALWPNTLRDDSGLIINSLGVIDVIPGGPSDGKIWPGDVVLEIEDQLIKTANELRFPFVVLDQGTRGLEMHTGQLIDAAEGRGKVRLKVLRKALPIYTSVEMNAPANGAEISLDVAGSDFVRLLVNSENAAIVNWLNPRFENGSGASIDLSAAMVGTSHGKLRSFGKDVKGAIVYDGGSVVSKVMSVSGNSMVEFAIPAGYTSLKFKLQTKSGKAIASVQTRFAEIATVPLKPRQFDAYARPVLPPQLIAYLETIEYDIPQLGSFGTYYDPLSAKVANYSAILAKRLASEQLPNGDFPSSGGSYSQDGFRNAMAGLGLLATGDPAYNDNIRRAAYFVGASTTAKEGWNFPRGTVLMFLSEYYLRTHDEGILPILQNAVDLTWQQMLPDGTWGHHSNPGYGGSGFLGGTGPCLAGLAIASLTPAKVDMAKLDFCLLRAQSLAGHNGGNLPYGRTPNPKPFPLKTNNLDQTRACGNGGCVLAMKIRGGPEYITEIYRQKCAEGLYGNGDKGHASEALTFLFGSYAVGIFGDEAHKKLMSTFLWRLTLKRDFAGYINTNTNRLEYHGGDGNVHGGATFDTGGYLVLLNTLKRNLAMTGKPEFLAQEFIKEGPTNIADDALHIQIRSNWDMVEAALGAKTPAAMSANLAALRQLPRGPGLGERVIQFLQSNAPAVAEALNQIPGLNSPEKQYYIEMVLGLHHKIVVAPTSKIPPLSGSAEHQFSLNGFTANSQWAKWSGSYPPVNISAPTLEMSGKVTVTDLSGLYLAQPQVLNFAKGNLNPSILFNHPVDQESRFRADFDYTVAGIRITYSRDILIHPNDPIPSDNRNEDFTNYRKIWVNGIAADPFTKWALPVQLSSGQMLPGASVLEGDFGFKGFVNGAPLTLGKYGQQTQVTSRYFAQPDPDHEIRLPVETIIQPSAAFRTLISGRLCGYWLTSANQFNEVPVLGVNFLDSPNVTTSLASSITNSGAISGGNIITDNNLPVLARGVCWSFSTYPTIFDSKTADGFGTGYFTMVSFRRSFLLLPLSMIFLMDNK